MNSIFEWVTQKVCELLERPELSQQIQSDSRLMELGLHSIAFIRLVVEIEKQFEISISDNDMFLERFEKISDVVEYILQLQTSVTERV